MGAKDALLARARTVLVIEIEPAFADADDLGMPRQRTQRRRVGLRLAGGFVRMDADRAPDIVFSLSKRPHIVEFAHFRTNRQKAADARAAGARQHLAALGGEIREVEMA